MTRLIGVIGGFVTMALLGVACTNEVADEQPIDTTGITQQASISECGGFAQGRDGDDTTAYCDAEVLVWSYDSAQQELLLANNRIELNCCGEHSMDIVMEGETYVVTETDAPEMFDGEGARCGCTCVFDFGITAGGMPNEIIELRLDRNVTDGEGLVTVFDGSIDLTQGSGSIVIDDTPSMWCEVVSGSGD